VDRYIQPDTADSSSCILLSPSIRSPSNGSAAKGHKGSLCFTVSVPCSCLIITRLGIVKGRGVETREKGVETVSIARMCFRCPTIASYNRVAKGRPVHLGLCVSR
jgi:hypothetical protein